MFKKNLAIAAGAYCMLFRDTHSVVLEGNNVSTDVLTEAPIYQQKKKHTTVCGIGQKIDPGNHSNCICDVDNNFVQDKFGLYCVCNEADHYTLVGDACICNVDMGYIEDLIGSCICEEENTVPDIVGICRCDTSKGYALNLVDGICVCDAELNFFSDPETQICA